MELSFWSRSLFAVLITPVLVFIAPVTRAQGLPGVGSGAKGLGVIDPKAMAFEAELLERVNGLRGKKKLDALVMDGQLRLFSRGQAEAAARGEADVDAVHRAIKSQKLAPYGYHLHFVYARNTREAVTSLRKDPATTKALMGDFQLAGVGAFWVPTEKPYFQIMLLLKRQPDPMAGKTGLSKADTDPVMKEATARFKGCYDEALGQNPNLKGGIVLKLVIGGDGRVSEASFLKGLGDGAFDRCALSVARSLRFPKPYKGKPVTLNHPMRFTPPHGNKRVGQLTAMQISSTFGQARLDFHACYENRLEAKPDLGGTLEIALTVQPDGSATAVRVKRDNAKDLALTRCILKRAQKLRFPAPKFGGTVDVNYPLDFTPPER